jgi:hypothetical protein
LPQNLGVRGDDERPVAAGRGAYPDDKRLEMLVYLAHLCAVMATKEPKHVGVFSHRVKVGVIGNVAVAGKAANFISVIRI